LTISGSIFFHKHSFLERSSKILQQYFTVSVLPILGLSWFASFYIAFRKISGHSVLSVIYS